MNRYRAEDFFNLSGKAAADLFCHIEYVWDGVEALPDFIEDNLEPNVFGEIEKGAWLEPGRVSLGRGSRVERGAIVRGPTIIGENTVIRSGAYIRGHLMIGDRCLIGWGSELRQTLILNDTRIPHFNAVFTSLVGNGINFAGRTSTANLRLDSGQVLIRVPVGDRLQSFSTGRTLFGAVIGDNTNIGGDVSLQPGTIVGQRCTIYPKVSVSGYIPNDSIVRIKMPSIEIVPKKN